MKKKLPPLPSVSYTFTVRLRFEYRVGKMVEILSAISRAGGDMGAVDIVRVEPKTAAKAIADGISAVELNEEYIVPSVFNRRVARQVARAVAAAAHGSGVARRRSG